MRHNLVEMQMLEQLEPGRAEDMRVLQHLYGIPIAALDEQRQRCPRDGNQNGFLSGKKSVHDAVVGLVREAASEDSIDIPFHHRWHRQPPERVEDRQDIGTTNVVLCLHHIGADWMIDADGRKLVRSQNGVESHAVQIVDTLAVPELFQFSGIGVRQKAFRIGSLVD